MTETQRVEHYHHQADNLKVTLTRGQRGGYGWEIQISGHSIDGIYNELENIDAALRAKYATEEKPT